jgi:hypothetical protein
LASDSKKIIHSNYKTWDILGKRESTGSIGHLRMMKIEAKTIASLFLLLIRRRTDITLRGGCALTKMPPF